MLSRRRPECWNIGYGKSGNDYFYRVQLGAFGSGENAEKYLAEAKKKRFEGMIVKVKK